MTRYKFVLLGMILGATGLAGMASAQGSDSSSMAKNGSTGPAAQPKQPATDHPAVTPAQVPVDYVVGESDSLNITVWKERDLNQTVQVRPDGKISFPLVNELKVSGMTPTQIQALLEEQLKNYLVAPHVTVTVTEIRSRVVYITGEVAKPGAYSLLGPMNVLQLIAKANGLGTYAKRSKIFILRKVDGSQVRYPFNYDQVVRGKGASQNINLQPGDAVVVP